MQTLILPDIPRMWREEMQTLKHTIDVSNLLEQGNNVVREIPIVTGTEEPVVRTGNAARVRGGSIIKHIEVMVDIGPPTHLSAVIDSVPYMFDCYIGFRQTGQTLAEMPIPGLVGYNSLRNQVFMEDEALLHSSNNAGIGTAGVENLGHRKFRWSINVPPAWSKFNVGDNLSFFYVYNSLNIANWAVNTKLKAIFKEFEP